MFLINFQTSKLVCRLLLELQSSFPEQGHPLERLHHSCHWHFRQKFSNKSSSLSRQLQTRIDGRSWRHLHWSPGREDWRRQRLCCLSRSGSPPTKASSRCPIDGGRRNIRGSWCRASSSLSFRIGFRKSWRRRGCPSWRPAWWWRDCLLSKCHCKIFCRTTPGKWPENILKVYTKALMTYHFLFSFYLSYRVKKQGYVLFMFNLIKLPGWVVSEGECCLWSGFPEQFGRDRVLQQDQPWSHFGSSSHFLSNQGSLPFPGFGGSVKQKFKFKLEKLNYQIEIKVILCFEIYRLWKTLVLCAQNCSKLHLFAEKMISQIRQIFEL